VAAAALVAAFFLPWVEVDGDVARRFERRMEERLSDPMRPAPQNADDWRRLATLLVEEGAVTGLDVFYWARTAWRHAGDLRVAEAGTGADDDVARRGILLVAIVLAAVPLLSVVLGLYFVAHRLRRARSPALILAMLTGAAAIATAGVYGIVRGAITPETHPAPTFSLVLGGGAVLFLAGAFGVRVRNWWRVLGGTLVVGSALAGLAWSWIQWGISP
jgi:hypothetical protein